MRGSIFLGLAAPFALGAALVSARAEAQAAPRHDPPPAVPAPPRPAPGDARRPTPPPLQIQGAPGHGPPPGAPRPGDPHGALRLGPPGAARAESGHAAGGHGSEHGGHAEHDEKAPPPPINWWHGLIAEKADEPPGLLWRAPGEPPPFLASLINFAALVFIVVRFGKKPIAAALTKRKETILREIEDAERIRKAAEERLAAYEAKLAKISEELDQLRRQFREQGEHDKQRMLTEAQERRGRMREDTQLLLSQEAKQVRQELLAEVVRDAARLATTLLGREMTLGDHDRFAESFLGELRAGQKSRGAPAAKGGLS